MIRNYSYRLEDHVQKNSWRVFKSDISLTSEETTNITDPVFLNPCFFPLIECNRIFWNTGNADRHVLTLHRYQGWYHGIEGRRSDISRQALGLFYLGVPSPYRTLFYLTVTISGPYQSAIGESLCMY